MKSVVLAGIFAMFGSVAMADGFAVVGETEYAFEAETFSGELGGEYTRNDWRLTGMTLYEDTTDEDFDLVGVEVELGYALTDGVEAYVRVEADDELENEETIVGASFEF